MKKYNLDLSIKSVQKFNIKLYHVNAHAEILSECSATSKQVYENNAH